MKDSTELIYSMLSFSISLIGTHQAVTEFECGTIEADSNGGANVEIRHEILFSIG